ncbi:hypothetical protein GCM10010297_03010 [Streptomyces malachitofuscus]|nr:hypothetical protein GCM10010297_03010 [Streptomyces malachitofuscus]
MLPEATPTTLPTAVTAVAEATANPRTEIRLTRFPSSIARFGDPRGRNRAPDTGLPNFGSREARARWATPTRGAPRGARAAYDDAMELKRVLLWCRTAGGTAVSYAGPDRSETLP